LAKKFKVIIAPDKFKQSLTSLKAAAAIKEGLRKADPTWELKAVPLADGGEGTVAALTYALNGKVKKVKVTGPLGEKVEAEYGLVEVNNKKQGIIEIAQAAGLHLVTKNKPLKATTYGVGETITAALNDGCQELIIGLGGSATTDAGVGLVQALGGEFLKQDGEPVSFGGQSLLDLAHINLKKLDPRLKKTKITVAADVDNPLYGPQGAAYVYAPQKGANPAEVKLLDKALQNLAKVAKQDLNVEMAKWPGGGAAGGLGAGLKAFLGAELQSGTKLILNTVKFSEQIKGADLIITGEGRFDQQSLRGKLPVGVGQEAKKTGIPVVVLAGAVAPETLPYLSDFGIAAAFSINFSPVSLEKAKKQAYTSLVNAAWQIGCLLKAFPAV
jgi:glycerate kinase